MPEKKKHSKRKKRSSGGGNSYGGVAKKIKPVAEAIEEDYLKALIHGRSASGKTTFACDFPKPLLIIDCKEKGTKSVRNVDGVFVYRATTFEEVQEALWFLIANKDGYKTVIVDTVSQLQALAITVVLGSKAKTVKGGLRWGSITQSQYGDIAQNMKSLISDFKDLNMHVVFLAQERVFTVEEDEEEDADALLPEVGPSVMPSIAGSLNAAVDYAFSTFVRIRTIKNKKTRKKTKRIEYCMRIGPHTYYYTKVRSPKGKATPDIIVDPTFAKLEAIIQGEYENGKKKKRQQKRRVKR